MIEAAPVRVKLRSRANAFHLGSLFTLLAVTALASTSPACSMRTPAGGSASKSDAGINEDVSNEKGVDREDSTSSAGTTATAGDLLSCPEATMDPAAEPPQKVRDAVAAYDAGLYQEALPLLEALDAEGMADGILLYRLAYCHSATRRPAELVEQTYARSRTALMGKASTGAATLEDHFYLVNVLLNEGSTGEARKAALEATTRLESCDVPVGRSGREAFRAGKLYGDSGNASRQADWYRVALDRFQQEPNAPSAYIERAHRAIAGAELLEADPLEAVKSLAAISRMRPSDQSVLINLILARIRAGQIGTRVQRDIDRLKKSSGPRNTESAYIRGMADKALRMSISAGVEEIAIEGLSRQEIERLVMEGRKERQRTIRELVPIHDGNGRPLSALGREEIEESMKEAAAEGREILDVEPDAENSIAAIRQHDGREFRHPGPELIERMDRSQGRLMGSSMEVLRRGVSLQETAFVLQMSNLVMQDWHRLWIERHNPEPEAEEEPIESQDPLSE